MATLQENIDRIEQAKLDIKQAIIEKGVAIADTDRLDTYAFKIGEIQTSSGEVEESHPYYSCPWTPDEFIRRVKSDEWAYKSSGSVKVGYICAPELGVYVTGTDDWNGNDEWPRFYWDGENCNIQLNKQYEEWKEPSLDPYTLTHILGDNGIKPILYDPSWGHHISWDSMKGKPVESNVKHYTYSDFRNTSKEIHFLYSNGNSNNSFVDESESRTTITHPATNNEYSLPLMPVVEGGYAVDVSHNSEPGKQPYYGIIVYDDTNNTTDYVIDHSTGEPVVTFKGNIRYDNISHFMILYDKATDQYYDLSTITLNLSSSRPQPFTNMVYAHKLKLGRYDCEQNNLKNLRSIDYAELSYRYTFPSTLERIGEVKTNGYLPSFSGCKNLKRIPWIDTSGITDFYSMFFSCESLEEIPNLDFSSATRLQNTFRYCRLLKELPALNTSNVTNMSGVLSYTGVTEVPNWDFSNVTNMSESFNGSNIEVVDIELPKVENLASAFSYCSNLKRVERLYAPNCTTFISTFFYARELEYLAELDFSKATQLGSFFGNLTMDKLTDVGGFKNLKVSWNTNAGLDKCPNLTYESLMNILNGLYDFVGNGEEGGKIIKLSKQAQSKLSDDDIAVAINKGWTVNFG